MAQLLICPTCGGKISSNTTTCPHCGETEFFQNVTETRFVECEHCSGTGIEFRIAYSSDYHSGFYASEANISTLGCRRDLTIFHVNDTTGRRCQVGIQDDAPNRNLMIQSIREHNFLLKPWPNSFFDLYYDPQPCPVCDGMGKLDVKVVTRKIDLRKKIL